MLKPVSATLVLLVACSACIQVMPTSLMDVSNQLTRYQAGSREDGLLGLYLSASGTWFAFSTSRDAAVIYFFSEEEVVLVSARGAEKPQLEVKAIAFSWAYRASGR